LKTLSIIVNYKAAGLTLRAVRSVLDSESIGPVQVVVVENSEDKGEAECLRSNLPLGVVLLVNPKNIGFGRACNQAYEKFASELILLINPDARLLPGCLLRLQRTLSRVEKIAAVAPQVYWDKELTFLLPPSYPPALFLFQPALGSWGPQARINRLISALWRRHSIKVWMSTKPVKVNNLSGGLVLLKAEAVQKAGGLFDPLFFMYFEDTDLCIRLREAGHSLMIEPRAKGLHYYDQCGRMNWLWKRELMARSHQMFVEKHCKGWRFCMKRTLDRFSASKPPIGVQSGMVCLTAPFLLDVTESLQNGWLFEWSPNPDFIPSVGRFGKGPQMSFPEKCWSMLSPGQYFGRLGNPKGLGMDARVISWVVGKD